MRVGVLNCGMSVLFRCRVDDRLLAKAKCVTEALGTDPAEAFRMFLTEMVRTQRLPLALSLKGEGELEKKRRNEILRGLDDSEGW